MFTEKTLGKLEMLQDYLSEQHPEDQVAKTILKSISLDLKIPQEQEVSTELRLIPSKAELTHKAKHIPKSQSIKKYPEKIDLSKTNKSNFQTLVNKSVENKKWENSTILKRATYNKGSKVLTVYEKHNVIHEYHNVPQAIKEALFKNGKPGKYYHTYIQGQYKSKDVSLIG